MATEQCRVGMDCGSWVQGAGFLGKEGETVGMVDQGNLLVEVGMVGTEIHFETEMEMDFQENYSKNAKNSEKKSGIFSLPFDLEKKEEEEGGISEVENLSFVVLV